MFDELLVVVGSSTDVEPLAKQRLQAGGRLFVLLTEQSPHCHKCGIPTSLPDVKGMCRSSVPLAAAVSLACSCSISGKSGKTPPPTSRMRSQRPTQDGELPAPSVLQRGDDFVSPSQWSLSTYKSVRRMSTAMKKMSLFVGSDRASNYAVHPIPGHRQLGKKRIGRAKD